MNRPKYLQFVISAFILFLVMLLIIFPTGCTESQQQTLDGLIQKIDIVDGKITVVTKDGQTHTITISSDTQVQVDGQSASVGALEPGAEVEIEVEKDGTAQKVNRRISNAEGTFTRAEGTIVGLQGDTLTIDTRSGQIVVEIANSTRIEKEDNRAGNISDLKMGSGVEAYFNPDTRIASRIEIESRESEEDSSEVEHQEVSRGEAEGIIVSLQGDTLTIATERGQIAVEIANSTRIEKEDSSLGNISNLAEGIKVKAYFNPDTRIASRIEIESRESEEDSSEVEHQEVSRGEAEGTIVSLQGDTLTIATERGQIAVEIANSTRIEKEDSSLGNISNLAEGIKVKAYFDPATKIASRIRIEEGD